MSSTDKVIVTDVADGCAASGLVMKGDKVLAINGTPVIDESKGRAMARAAVGEVVFLILRGTAHMTITVDKPEATTRLGVTMKNPMPAQPSMAAAGQSTMLTQPAMQVMSVQVPQGMQGGMPLQVQTPGGVMHVQIPPGLQPGMVFEMQVPMSQPTIAPQPMAMYGGGGEVVQGETGADFQGATYCGDGIVSIELDRRPVVQPGTEHMTIAGEMHEDCCGCGNPNFDMQYQPGKVAITESEFDAAIMEMNSVLKRPLWWYLCYPLVCPLSVCTGERLGLYETTGPDLQRKAKQLSNKYAAQGVKFSIRRKQERIVDTDDYFGELDADISDTFFLLVRQGVVQR